MHQAELWHHCTSVLLLLFDLCLLYSTEKCSVCGTAVTKPLSRKGAKKQKAAESFEAAAFYTGHPDAKKPAGVTAKAMQNYRVCLGDINNSQSVGTTTDSGMTVLVAYVCSLV
jgi:hypothetical protein